MYVTICGRFCLNEGGAAGCVNRMKAKYHAKWGVQIAGMIFRVLGITPNTKFVYSLSGGTFCPHSGNVAKILFRFIIHTTGIYLLLI